VPKGYREFAIGVTCIANNVGVAMAGFIGKNYFKLKVTFKQFG
jgi:hypothetical protein